MTSISLFAPISLFCWISLMSQASAQDDVDECALNCVANVDGTNCTQSQWTCLCDDNMYIGRLNNCTIASCNATDQDSTFSAVAELCAIFSIPITIEPEATAATSTSNSLFSTVAIPSFSSLPPVSTLTTPNSSVSPSMLSSAGGASTSRGSTTTTLSVSTHPAESTSQSTVGSLSGATASASQSPNNLHPFGSSSMLALVLAMTVITRLMNVPHS